MKECHMTVQQLFLQDEQLLAEGRAVCMATGDAYRPQHELQVQHGTCCPAHAAAAHQGRIRQLDSVQLLFHLQGPLLHQALNVRHCIADVHYAARLCLHSHQQAPCQWRHVQGAQPAVFSLSACRLLRGLG